MAFNLIREKGREGRRGYTLPKPDVETKDLENVVPKSALRKEKPRLAEVDEPTVVRHYTNLSRQNQGIDTTFYPLGSCTMKHNPRANEAAANGPGRAAPPPGQRGGGQRPRFRRLAPAPAGRAGAGSFAGHARVAKLSRGGLGASGGLVA